MKLIHSQLNYANVKPVTDVKGAAVITKIVVAKKVAEKSIYTLAREERFRKAFLKKYADRIAAIHEVFPDWEPII